MREKLILFLIIIFNFITRFWKMGEIPKLLDNHYLLLRVVSGTLGIVIPILLYLLISRAYKNKKLAFLTAFIFSLLPQSMIEGRIVSFLIYPQFDLPSSISPAKFIINFLNLVSFDTLFFQNKTFYWGGIRETGIMYLAMLPYFFSGLYFLIVSRQIKPIIFLTAVFTIVSLVPSFPESRLIYLAFPFLSLIISRGMLTLWKKNSFYLKIFNICLIIFLIYELFQFFHFYGVHYPKQINDFSQNIKGAF